MNEPLLSSEAIAEALGVSAGTVRAWPGQGCPHYRIINRPRFRLEEVKAWRAACKPKRPAPPPLRLGLIYFIGARERWPIKVGWTVRVVGRIPTLQTGTWEELVCHGTIPGTQADEQAIHKELDAHRIRGEWFEREPALALLAVRR